LIAAVSDTVAPVARAPIVGVYRFWRDMGYVAGGLIIGLLADAIDFSAAIAIVAALTAASGAWAALEITPPTRRGTSSLAAPLLDIDEEARPDDVGGDPGADDALRERIHGS
jgi:hypothetical protein